MPWFIHGGMEIERSMIQFMEATQMTILESPERLETLREFAQEQPRQRFYLSPGIFQGLDTLPESPENRELLGWVRDTLHSLPGNVVVPSAWAPRRGAVHTTFLNVGKRGKASPEGVALELGARDDTLWVCPVSSTDVGRILSEKGRGESAFFPVFEDEAFHEVYAGYAPLAAVWFSCWLSDSVAHWETRVGYEGERASSLAYQFGRRLAEFFRLDVLYDKEAAQDSRAA